MLRKKIQQIKLIIHSIDPNKINESIQTLCHALSIAGSGLNPLENLKDYADVLSKLWKRLQPPSKCEDISASCVLPQALCEKITAESQKAVQGVWRSILNLIKKDLEKGKERSAILAPSSLPGLFSELIRIEEWLMVQTIVQLTKPEQIEDLIGTIKIVGTAFDIQQKYDISGPTFLRMIKAGLLSEYLEKGKTEKIKNFIKDCIKEEPLEGAQNKDAKNCITEALDSLSAALLEYKKLPTQGFKSLKSFYVSKWMEKAGTGLGTLSSIEDYYTPLNKQYIQLGYRQKILSADCILKSEFCKQLTATTQRCVIDKWNNFLTFIKNDLNEADSFIINHGFVDALRDNAWLAVQAIVLLSNPEQREIILASTDVLDKTVEDYINEKYEMTGKQFLLVVEAGKLYTLLKEGKASTEVKNILNQVTEKFVVQNLQSVGKDIANYAKALGDYDEEKARMHFRNLMRKLGTGLGTLSSMGDYYGYGPLYKQHDFFSRKEKVVFLSGYCILKSEFCDRLDSKTQQRVTDVWHNFLVFIQDDLDKKGRSIILNHGFADALRDNAWLAVQAIVLLSNPEQREIILTSTDELNKTAEDYIQKQFKITGKEFLKVVEAGKFSTLLKDGKTSPKIQRIIEAVR